MPVTCLRRHWPLSTSQRQPPGHHDPDLLSAKAKPPPPHRRLPGMPDCRRADSKAGLWLQAMKGPAALAMYRMHEHHHTVMTDLLTLSSHSLLHFKDAGAEGVPVVAAPSSSVVMGAFWMGSTMGAGMVTLPLTWLWLPEGGGGAWA